MMADGHISTHFSSLLQYLLLTAKTRYKLVLLLLKMTVTQYLSESLGS